MTAVTEQMSGRLEAACLTQPPVEWGVFSFNKRRARHEISKHHDRGTALDARNKIRRRVDALALLMYYDLAAGRWRPVTGVEVAR